MHIVHGKIHNPLTTPNNLPTTNLLPDDLAATGVFLAKGNGVVAGLPVVEYFFSRPDTSVLINRVAAEGAFIRAGEIIATISGRARTLLSGERIALNFLQRLSGIATITAQFVEKIKPMKTAIMDTRKTTPGWRYLEKRLLYSSRRGNFSSPNFFNGVLPP